MKNNFVSVKALMSEIRRIIPFTSNPVINEALLNCRISEVSALSGKVAEAVSIMQDVMAIMLNSETCPESGNLFYSHLNVLLHNYEHFPTDEKKTYYLEMGYNGLRMIRDLQEDISANWKVYFMLRMSFCALDLSINGRPLYFKPKDINLQTVQCFLSEIENVVDLFGKRRKMMFHLASGRMMHLKGMDIEAVAHLTKAMDLALEGGFVESQSISDYMKNISQQEDVI
jgi:hypothetical protein